MPILHMWRMILSDTGSPKKVSIGDYKFIGGQLVKCEIEDNYNLVFSFVLGDGNKRQYMQKN